MTQEMEQTINQEMEQTINPDIKKVEFLSFENEGGKTRNYCFEFKVTWESKWFLNSGEMYKGVFPKVSSLEKIFLKDYILRYNDYWLEELGKMDSKPRINKSLDILTTDMKIVRSENEPDKLEWYFRISDLYKVKVDVGDNSHIEFLKSDNLQERMKQLLTCVNFIDKSFYPKMVLSCPDSVELNYKKSYGPDQPRLVYWGPDWNPNN